MIVKGIVDLSQVIHANHSIALREGMDMAELPRMVVTNVSNIFSRLAAEIPQIKAYVAADSRPSFRSELYPEYKAHRPDKGIDHDAIEAAVSERFFLLKHPKLEADDIMHLFAKENIGKAGVILISNDSDMSQVLDETQAVQYDYKQQKMKTYRKGEWKSKLVLGDDSDNIPRIAPRGYGEGKFFKAIDSGKTVAQIVDDFGMNPNEGIPLMVYKLVRFSDKIYEQYVPDLQLIKKLVTK